jgi:hypothetical protein
MPLFNPPVASVTGLRKGAGTGDQDLAAVAGLDFAVPSSAVATPNGLVSGGGVAWTGTGLVFTVSAASYVINGISYSSVQTDLTLGTADVTNPRIDVFAVNSSGAAIVIAGTPAASPIAPSVDPATQLQLTFIQVAANATTPSNVVVTTLYAENIEDTSSVSSNFNAASTSNPHAGTKDIEATTATTGNFVQLQKASGSRDLSTQNALIFYIRSKAAWGNNRSLTITFLNAGVQVGNAITFKDASFGFTSSNTSSYQQIIIPIAQFGAGSNAVTQLKFTVGGSGGTIGFYLDDISLQSGQQFLADLHAVARDLERDRRLRSQRRGRVSRHCLHRAKCQLQFDSDEHEHKLASRRSDQSLDQRHRRRPRRCSFDRGERLFHRSLQRQNHRLEYQRRRSFAHLHLRRLENHDGDRQPDRDQHHHGHEARAFYRQCSSFKHHDRLESDDFQRG